MFFDRLKKAQRWFCQPTPAARRSRAARLFLESLENRLAPTVTPLGAEFQVNTYTFLDQSLFPNANKPIAGDANGNFVVVWTSTGEDGSGLGVYAQRYNPQGVPQGVEFRVANTTAGDQLHPAVAMDAAGDFVVTWTSSDGSGTGVFARRFDTQGNAQGNEFRVNNVTNNDQKWSSVAMDSTGNFVVTWTSVAQDGDKNGIFGRRFNVTTNSLETEFAINTTTTNDQQNSSIAMAPQGGFVVTWYDAGVTGNHTGVYARKFSADTTPVTPEIPVQAAAIAPTFTSIAMNDQGQFVVAWSNKATGTQADADIFARQFDPLGVPLAAAFRVNTVLPSDQVNPMVSSDAQGNFAIVWQGDPNSTTFPGVFGRTFNYRGAALEDEFRISPLVTRSFINPAVLLNPGLQAVFAWTALNGQDGSGAGVYSRRFQVTSPPSLSISGTQANQAVNDNATINPFTTTSVLDIADPSEMLVTTVRLSDAANGRFTMTSLQDSGFVDQTNGVYTYNGTADQATAAIRQLVFAPTNNQVKPGTKVTTTFTITTSNGAESANDANTSVVATSINDAPTDIGLDNLVVPENSPPGTVVGHFSVIDQDTGDTFTYTLIDNAGARFRIANGTELQVNGPLDFEAAAGYTIRARVTDAGGKLFDKDFVLQVTDVAESLTLSLSKTTISEDAGPGAAVATLTRVNGDTNVPLTVTLQSSSPNKAHVAPTITIPAGLTTVTFGVDAVDNTLLDGTQPVTISASAPSGFAGANVGLQVTDAEALTLALSANPIREGTGSTTVTLTRSNTDTNNPLTVTLTASDPNRVAMPPSVVIPASQQSVTFDVFTTDDATLNATPSVTITGTAAGYTSGNAVLQIIDDEGPADDFNRGDSPNLGGKWTNQAGAFAVSGNKALSATGVGLATFNSAPIADADLQVKLNLPKTGTQYGGVVARYQGTGDRNMFWGALVGVNGAFTAEIWRNLNGSWLLLSRTAVGTGTGTLRFQVIGNSLKLYLNDRVVGYAFDNVLAAPGLVGIRGYATPLDDFATTPLFVQNQHPPFTDSFDQADGSSIDVLKWQGRFGSYIVSNPQPGTDGVVRGDAGLNMATLYGVSTANVALSMDLAMTSTTTVEYAGLVARYGNTTVDTNMYWGEVENVKGAFSAVIWKNVGGTWTALSRQAVPTGTGKLQLFVFGDSLRLVFNDKLVGFANDGSLTTGGVGIRGYQNTTVNNFHAEGFNPIAPTLPYSDSFTLADGATLSNDWYVRAGNFTAQGGKVAGDAAINIAVLNGVSLANVTLRVDFDLATTGVQYGGLMARYGGPGDQNMYWGAVVGVNGTYTAEIWRNLNGSLTKLATANLNSGTGTLEFKAIGSDLTLSWNGTQVATASDVTIATGGIGIRGNKGTAFDNFTAL
jgi:hypothetical protein